MKVKIKNKRSLIAIAIILVLVAIGGVIAYHTSKGFFINDLHPANLEWSAVDEFVSPNNWKHCERTPKIIKATNGGDGAAIIRIKLEEYWKKAGSTSTTHETELPLTLNGTKLTYYNLNQSNEWIAEDGGWYRYARPLGAGEETTPLITFVDFSCEAKQIFENTDCETTNGQTVCTNNQNDYNNAKYHLYATVEGSAAANTDHVKTTKLRDAYYINTYMKQLANPTESVTSEDFYDSNVRAIKTASSLPDGFEAGSYNVFSTSSSECPMYGWFDSGTGTIYFYTEADYIEVNTSLAWAFAHFHALTDISGLANWHTAKTTSFDVMFYESNSIPNVNALAKWDTSNVANMTWTFHTTSSLTDISGLSNWRTDNVKNMYNTFGNSGFTDATPLTHWNTQNVENMGALFYGVKITSSAPFTYWNTSKVTNLGSTFNYTDLHDVTGLSNWDVSKVTDTGWMFGNNNNITSLAPLANWNLASIEYSAGMFSGVPDNVTRPAWYQ